MSENKPTNYLVLVFVIGLAVGILITTGANKYAEVNDCISNETLMNQTNLSFQYGASEGIQYAINVIGSEATQCKEVPMIFQNQTYSIVAVECLNLNKQEVQQNANN